MMQPDFDPSRTIILHGGEALEADSAAAGETVKIERDDPGGVIVKATVTSPGYLFYSGNYLGKKKIVSLGAGYDYQQQVYENIQTVYEVSYCLHDVPV